MLLTEGIVVPLFFYFILEYIPRKELSNVLIMKALGPYDILVFAIMAVR